MANQRLKTTRNARTGRKRKPKPEKLYPLDRKKHGMGGVIRTKPKRRKQDREFLPGVFYAVVFFPKIEGIGEARVWQGVFESLAQTPEAAITKHMDGIAKGEKWEIYRKAGWKVRKVQISDLGPARVKRP